jgi:hypothetical protein
MSDTRINVGPWTGAVTDSSATIKLSVFRGLERKRLIVSWDEDGQTREKAFESEPLPWVDDAEERYRHEIVTFRLSGLRAATEHKYVVELDGELETLPFRTGRFRTFPTPGLASDFSFLLSSCSANLKAPLSSLLTLRPEVWVTLADEAKRPDVLFFFHLGDLYYDIDDVRIGDRLEKYDWMLARPEVGNFFRAIPVAYCWDDHDFLGDGSSGGSTDTLVLQKAANALKGYDIYVPHYELPPGSDGIYQSFVIGRVLFLLTDTRFRRTTGSSGGERTMLGRAQKRWLKEMLLRGSMLNPDGTPKPDPQYDLIVWANSVPWLSTQGADTWAGFADERKELATFIKTKHVDNLCMISGDAHMLAVDDGTGTGYAEGEPGRRGGFPLFQAASLESWNSQKGGPYSHGSFPGKRQYGLCEVRYNGRPIPEITFTGKKAKKGLDRDAVGAAGQSTVRLRYSFPARPSSQFF